MLSDSQGDRLRMDRDNAQNEALAPRTTETALAIPTLGRLGTNIGRALRLRCPECGAGKVLVPRAQAVEWGAVLPRCSHCGFRYERSDDRYFGGAMLVNLLVAEGTFAVGFCLAVLLSWPDVPWDLITAVSAIVMIAGPILWYPVAKVLWLGLDLAFRPSTPDEFR